jgi:nickel-dependent lactate racemase
MRVAVDYQSERLELEVPEERLVADWHGPAGMETEDVRRCVREALESPRQYPPLRQAVVPGDRVVVALDLEVSRAGGVLDAVCESLIEGGVETNAITVLTPPGADAHLRQEGVVPMGVVRAVHDPDDRDGLAYLATTTRERRVYLNRLLTDADVVVPVGRLGFDPVIGYRGPWSVLFPDLSDRETARSFRSTASAEWPDCDHPRPMFGESAEVSWLLGTQFHLGIVAGTRGPSAAVAGLESVVRAEGARALDRAWTFEAPSRAELVVVGIGQPGVATSLESLAQGLANAARLVERGGKIVALSRAAGPIGPGFQRLLEIDDPRLAPASLRGHDADLDYTAAYQVAHALAWADVYLLSALDSALIDDSPLIPLARPEEARRLVAACRSCLFLSQAECARARVAGEAPDA